MAGGACHGCDAGVSFSSLNSLRCEALVPWVPPTLPPFAGADVKPPAPDGGGGRETAGSACLGCDVGVSFSSLESLRCEAPAPWVPPTLPSFAKADVRPPAPDGGGGRETAGGARHGCGGDTSFSSLELLCCRAPVSWAPSPLPPFAEADTRPPAPDGGGGGRGPAGGVCHSCDRGASSSPLVPSRCRTLP